MSLDAAMRAACADVGIKPPVRTAAGRWVRTDTLERNGKGDGAVLIFDDMQGGIAWDWQTGTSKRFSIRDTGGDRSSLSPDIAREAARRRDARKRDAEEVAKIADGIVRACGIGPHEYLARKGFPTSEGLVIEDVRAAIPDTPMGQRIVAALPEHDAPLLIVPGRIGGRVLTVQFIKGGGDKKNILGGQMGGTSHRIASGRETWVCEGIATAMSVRDALRLLGRSATVLCAFSAANVAKVARGIPDAIIAADHDKPVDTLGGMGAGEYYARQSGCRWVQPAQVEDWNDMHMRDGLRAVALKLREVK